MLDVDIFNDTSSPSLHPPPPPDLTPRVVKLHNQYVEGGALGDVYLCQYSSSSGPMKVAVKALRFKFEVKLDAVDNKSVKMLWQELGIWRRLHHENVVPFLGIAYGFGKQGATSLVSSWMPNGALGSFLEKYDDQLSIGHRLQLLVDVASGLRYLHSFAVSPVIHGNLNSNNVLLDANYTARLTDFGLSSLAAEIPEALAYLQQTTVRPGAVRWTPPEQIQTSNSGRKRETKSAGKQPWSEIRENTAVIISLYKGHNPRRPENRPINDQHWGFIEQCWSSAQERPTAESIVSSVEQFLSCHLPFPPLCDTLAASSPQTQGLLTPTDPFRLERTGMAGWHDVGGEKEVPPFVLPNPPLAQWYLPFKRKTELKYTDPTFSPEERRAHFVKYYFAKETANIQPSASSPSAIAGLDSEGIGGEKCVNAEDLL